MKENRYACTMMKSNEKWFIHIFPEARHNLFEAKIGDHDLHAARPIVFINRDHAVKACKEINQRNGNGYQPELLPEDSPF